jgi:hypothetical protein
MHNPHWGSKDGELDTSLLGEEGYMYLDKSKALFGRPIDRLKYMNQPAVDLYQKNNIDLNTEYLEIAVCAQHNNGGLYGNIWWESNLKHLFPVGEVNGSHGVYRPGGSALNSGQVGSTRAAQYIAARYQNEPLPFEDFVAVISPQVKSKMNIGSDFLKYLGNKSNALERLFEFLDGNLNFILPRGFHRTCIPKVISDNIQNYVNYRYKIDNKLDHGIVAGVLFWEERKKDYYNRRRNHREETFIDDNRLWSRDILYNIHLSVAWTICLVQNESVTNCNQKV